jgi:hypothetical protein
MPLCASWMHDVQDFEISMAGRELDMANCQKVGSG